MYLSLVLKRNLGKRLSSILGLGEKPKQFKIKGTIWNRCNFEENYVSVIFLVYLILGNTIKSTELKSMQADVSTVFLSFSIGEK